MPIQLIRAHGVTLGLAASLALTAQSAFADLTAQDVWNVWKEQAMVRDLEVIATENLLGGILTLTDLTITGNQEDITFSLSLPSITFEERGDGTVNIILPETSNMDFKDGVAGTESVLGTFLTTQTGSKIIASGTADNIVLDYSLDSLTISMAQLDINEKDVAPHIDFDVTLHDIDARSNVKHGEMHNQSDTLTTAKLSYDIAVNSDDNDDGFSMQGELNDITYSGDTLYPTDADINANDVTQLLEAGLKYTGNFAYKNGSTATELRAEDVGFSSKTSSQSGTITAGIDIGGLTYSVQTDDTMINIVGDQIPFPIDLTMRQMGMGLTVPVAKSDEEQDFALALGLHDFAVPELLWSLVDPEGGLPHDPATLAFDVNGKLKLFFDPFDQEQIAAVETGAKTPGEINAVDINALELSVAGAELTGTGGFTFNNEDLETFDGMPAPTGEANLQLVGANTLISNLVDLGLLPQDKALGARMMMGLFTTPSEGEDTLTSRIQVQGNGEISANGQRLR